jgi:hypothetical protein
MKGDAGHRPYGLPEGRWSIAMTWHDLLFAHWRVDGDRLRGLLPGSLELDTFEGEAWIGVVPFWMTGIRHRCFPAVPGLRSFAELNVRTYVTAGGTAGVWFFSLDAAHAIAVRVARATYHLPYYRARMSARRNGQAVDYSSRRTHRGAKAAAFSGRYRPVSDLFQAEAGTLEYFLTERYCLYAEDGAGRLRRGEIHHAPWPLQRAKAEIGVNTMTEPLGVSLEGDGPLLHFARRLEVVAWRTAAMA